MAGILAFSGVHTVDVINAAETEDTVILSDIEKNDIANSFRYANGIPVSTQNAYKKASTSVEAWSKVDGSFVNDIGEIIPNAVAKGIDVSHHQKAIDWEKVKETDVDFAIIRCGYGQDIKSQDDKYWVANADSCTKNNIPFGTYIYSYATTKEKAIGEANHVLRLVKGYNLQYPIYYDLEDASMSNLSTRELADIAKAFCDTIEAAGYKAAIYANKYWFTKKLTNSVFDKWDRWVAEYNSTCSYTKPYTMWQCTSKGSVSGINGNTDINFVVQKEPLVPVTALTVSNAAITMKVMDTAAMNVTVMPLNAYEKKVNYQSSNHTIASVDENGIITAHQEGIAVITAQSEEESNISVSCTVTVSNEMPTTTPNITEQPTETPLTTPSVTEQPTETPLITPDITKQPTSVPLTTPTVTKQPTETPLITPEITKQPIETPDIIEPPIDTIALNQSTLTITVGKTADLIADTNSSETIIWTSSSKSVATVSSEGKITAKKPGKVIITAKLSETISASCVVYIKPSKIKDADFTAVSTNQLKLTWGKVSGVSGYAIYRYDSTNEEDILITSLSSSKLSYTFKKTNGKTGTALKAGYKYTYKVAPYKTIDGKKYYGSKTIVKTATKPKKTTVKKLKRLSSRTAKATWRKISASDGYVIYLSDNSSSNYKALLTIDNPKITSYTISGLKKGRTYYVKICTYRKLDGKTIYSNYSNIKKIKL